MKTILVTGASGQVGQELLALAAQFPDFQLIGLDRAALDVSDDAAVQAAFQRYAPDYCIHAAAYTAVDKAENDAENAYKINVVGTENIAKVCKMRGIRWIHLSTDYVYHGGQNTPLREDDAVAPKGVYARTKLEGEQAAQRVYPEGTLIVRTAWVYSSFGANFVKTMLRLGAERERLNVVFDQIGSPTYAADLAKALLQILQKEENQPSTHWGEIYHYSNEGVCSWYDFACAIMELRGLACRISPIESKDYPTPTPRPPFSVLNKAKIKNAFAIEIDHWRSALQRCLQLFP